MKTLLGALALVIAAPVAAQTPAAAPHADHTGHSQQQPQKPSQPAGDDHHMSDCKDCCDKMKKHGGKMDCCDEHRDSATKAPAEHSHHSH